jgi:hypothetical protein
MRCMSSRCRVSYADRKGLLHAIDVEAASLYEAVAIAVASFREDEVSPPEIDCMTEFTVAVYRNPTEHKIRLGQVQQWARSPPRKARRRLPSGIGCCSCWRSDPNQ